VDIAKESTKKIRQLEFVVNELQQRIGQIAMSYELEVAMLKSNVVELTNALKTQAEEVD
jgi:tetrahydromethanopterin S-methyltransferase subunit G